VWRAEGDDALGRHFAIKVFPQQGEAYQREVAALSAIEEVRAAAGSRDLVEVVGAGQAEGQGYVVMEYVRGGTLAERLEREGPLEARAAVELLVPVLRALELLHGAGLVHKDVKPANVLVGEDGHPRLGDFGLARPLEGPVSSAGTPGFCAPELYAGHDQEASRGAERVDVYSAGATLYALLCGPAPLPGRPDLFLLERRRIDRDLQGVLFQALAEDPAQRLAGARELREALEAWLRGEPTPTEVAPEDAAPRATKWVPLAALGLLLLALGLAVRGLPGGPLLWDGRHLSPVGPRLTWSQGAVTIEGLGRLELLEQAPVAVAFDGQGATLAVIGPQGEAVAVLLSPPAPRVLLRVAAGAPTGQVLCAVATDGRHLARVVSPLDSTQPTQLEVFAFDGTRVFERSDLPPAPALALLPRAGQALPTLILGGPDGRIRISTPGESAVSVHETHADEVRALALDTAQGLLLVLGDDRPSATSTTPRRVLKAYAFKDARLGALAWERPLPARAVVPR
jgi:hypothetical protein